MTGIGERAADLRIQCDGVRANGFVEDGGQAELGFGVEHARLRVEVGRRLECSARSHPESHEPRRVPQTPDELGVRPQGVRFGAQSIRHFHERSRFVHRRLTVDAKLTGIGIDEAPLRIDGRRPLACDPTCRRRDTVVRLEGAVLPK